MNLLKQGKWSMALSGLCALHCLTMPLLAVMFPFIGINFFHNRWIEWILLLSGFIIAANATLTSYFKIHRKPAIIWLTFSGFVLIAAAHITAAGVSEIALSLGGALLALFGLYKNQLLLKSCSR